MCVTLCVYLYIHVDVRAYNKRFIMFKHTSVHIYACMCLVLPVFYIKSFCPGAASEKGINTVDVMIPRSRQAGVSAGRVSRYDFGTNVYPRIVTKTTVVTGSH